MKIKIIMICLILVAPFGLISQKEKLVMHDGLLPENEKKVILEYSPQKVYELKK